MNNLTYTRETDADVWIFEAILQPIDSTSNVRGIGFIDAVNPAPLTIDVGAISEGAVLAPTTHQGFQKVQHQSRTSASTSPALNPAPLIIGGLMLAVAAIHVYGMVQYYRGSISNQVECKR